MKRLLVLCTVALAVPASASCIGTGAIKSCTDSSGNSYVVSRVGNSTFVNGTNADGETWNQHSFRAGNMTQTYGTAANGNSWNATSTPYATFGTDADGNPFFSPN